MPLSSGSERYAIQPAIVYLREIANFSLLFIVLGIWGKRAFGSKSRCRHEENFKERHFSVLGAGTAKKLNPSLLWAIWEGFGVIQVVLALFKGAFWAIMGILALFEAARKGL